MSRVLFKSFIVLGTLCLSMSTWAETESTSRALQSELVDGSALRKMPSSFRLSILGGASSIVDEKKFENDNTNTSGVLLSALMGYGKQMISYEIGATFMNVPYSLGVKNSFGTHRALVNIQYVGIPVNIKINFIDRPLSTFFVKVGAVPVWAIKQSSDQVVLKDKLAYAVTIPKNDVLVSAGFGGTTGLSESTSFILDLTGFYGTAATTADSHFQGISASLGVSVEI